jgi:hypothetical protein
MMKTMKQILFAAVVCIGFSMTAMAQKDGDKKPPKKPDPPVIVAPDKDKPKDTDKPKKPQEVIFIGVNQREIYSI